MYRDSIKRATVSFTGRLSLQDNLDLHRYHSRIMIRRSIRLLVAVISLSIALIMIKAGMRNGFEFISFLMLTLCAYFPFGWLILDRLSVKWRHQRNPDKLVDNTVIFTDETVSVANPTSDVRLSWSLISMIVSTPRGLLFILPPHNAWFWLPQRLFHKNSHKETILCLASEHEIPIRKMT